MRSMIEIFQLAKNELNMDKDSRVVASATIISKLNEGPFFVRFYLKCFEHSK